MPFFLFIYSDAILDEETCLKEYNGPCPEIPYFPIMRTLSILIASLIIGILVKWRFKRNKIIKKISKLGTILGFLVIMTFIVLALLIYEDAWLVNTNMWICAICIPLLGRQICFILFSTSVKVFEKYCNLLKARNTIWKIHQVCYLQWRTLFALLFCTVFARPKKQNKRDTHGFQMKKWRKCRIMYFLFASFFFKKEKYSLFYVCLFVL